MILTYRALDSDAGRSTLSILRRELQLSAAAVRRLRQSDAICVNGRSAFTTERLDPGEVVTADLLKAEPKSDLAPEQGDIDVLYEDEGLIAVNKPAGLLTHPSRARFTGTLANFVAWYLLQSSGVPYCHAVNRLDRDTSGVLLFAKNSYMKALACAALAMPDAEKEYIALVFGVPEPGKGIIDLPIIRLREGDMMRGVSPDGKRAVTRFETLGSLAVSGDSISLIKVRPETGRTHQIRVHFSAIGNPVLGDGLYGSERSRAVSEGLAITTQALHARRLVFAHPLSGERIEVTAAPPPLFKFVFDTQY